MNKQHSYFPTRRASLLKIVKSVLNKLVRGSQIIVRPLHAVDRWRLARQIRKITRLENPFAMIIMPGTLHVAELAASYCPKDIHLIIILNGLSAWERNWAVKHLKSAVTVRSGFAHPHDKTLEILVRNLPSDFGILDSDMLVLNPDCFRRIQLLGEGVAMNTYFILKNERTGLAIPQTFFLFFNLKIVTNVINKYRVGFVSYFWQDLPVLAQRRLAQLGLGPDNYPHSFKNAFDTLQAVMMLCLAEGHPFGILGQTSGAPRPDDNLFHVGAVSYWRGVNDVWKLRGAYFSMRLLEDHKDDELRQRYQKLFGCISPGEIRKQIDSAKQVSPAGFFEFVEKLVTQGRELKPAVKGTAGVSVIICCYNSATRLPETLKHLARQVMPPSVPWEVIVANNASTDDTAEVAIRVWQGLGQPVKLQVLHEPKPGKSFALETGFAAAKYEVIVTVDDDNWLDDSYLQTAFAVMNREPRIGVLGGCITAHFEEPPPPWFRYVQAAYAVGPQGRENGDATSCKPTVAGAGMVLRKSAYDQLKARNFKLCVQGNCGSKVVGGEDQELCFAMVLSGYRTWYDDRLRLTHFIPKARLTRDYFLSLVRATDAGMVLACYKAVWQEMGNSPLRFYLAGMKQRSQWVLNSAAKFVLGRMPLVPFQAQLIHWWRSLICLPALRRSFKLHYQEIVRLKNKSGASVS